VGIPSRDPLLPAGVAVVQGLQGLLTGNGILIDPGKKIDAELLNCLYGWDFVD
jgi:hypothetical protein